jgi:hypothetical protein
MKSRQESFFGFVAFLVCVSWAVCLFMAVYSATGGGLGKIENYGLVGDTFGSVNALFTGLALVGLVYTVSLQRTQTQAQVEQIQLQRVESSRQAREQFLTARLNAQIGALQAATAQQSTALAGERGDHRTRAAFLNSLNRIGIRIEILRHEAGLGFDGGAWSPALEKEALRLYLVNMLNELVASYDNAEKGGDHVASMGCAESGISTLRILEEIFRGQYPEIVPQLNIPRIMLEQNRHSLGVGIESCRNAHFTYQKGQFPWA